MFLREVFLMAEAEAQASKPRYASVCQASPGVTFSNNSTIKEWQVLHRNFRGAESSHGSWMSDYLLKNYLSNNGGKMKYQEPHTLVSLCSTFSFLEAQKGFSFILPLQTAKKKLDEY